MATASNIIRKNSKQNCLSLLAMSKRFNVNVIQKQNIHGSQLFGKGLCCHVNELSLVQTGSQTHNLSVRVSQKCTRLTKTKLSHRALHLHSARNIPLTPLLLFNYYAPELRKLIMT